MRLIRFTEHFDSTYDMTVVNLLAVVIVNNTSGRTCIEKAFPHALPYSRHPTLIAVADVDWFDWNTPMVDRLERLFRPHTLEVIIPLLE